MCGNPDAGFKAASRRDSVRIVRLRTDRRERLHPSITSASRTYLFTVFRPNLKDEKDRRVRARVRGHNRPIVSDLPGGMRKMLRRTMLGALASLAALAADSTFS